VLQAWWSWTCLAQTPMGACLGSPCLSQSCLPHVFDHALPKYPRSVRAAYCQRSNYGLGPVLFLLPSNNADAPFRSLATMAAHAPDDDPFKDPSIGAASAPQTCHPAPAHVPDTLAVGRNASLTLGTDSLVVLGELSRHSASAYPLTGYR